MASDCNVKVICRFRPINQRELKEGANSEVTIEYPNESSVNIVEESNKQPQLFTLDRVFNSDTKQEQIFETISESINDVIEGFNATIFAYGQTGSGKSFTMFGPSIEEEELCGIIPRSCKYIFDYIHSDTTGIEFTIKCSFLEIYKEDVKDLLNPSKQQKSLRIRESASKGVWVEGLVEICVTSVNEVLDLLKTGEKFRTVTSTNMNAVSSRSHSLFILTLIQKMKDGSVKTGKLNLADLAGSEKVGKTGAKGNTLEEAKKINQSLSSLGNCINALTKENKAHVPYRDSKLTFILRESLGGNTKTTLIVACSPHPFNITETLSTLRFAQRAKTIKNTVTVNTKRSVEELESIIKGLLLELNDLKYYVKHLEKELSVFKGSEWSPEIEKKKIFENRNQHLPTLNISETSEKPNTEITPNTNPENTQIQEVMSKIESTTQKDLNQIENQVRIDKINEQLKEEIESLKDQVNTFKEEEQVSKKQINTLKETLQQKEEELKKISHEFQSIKQKTSTDSEKLEYVSKQLRYEIETSKLELKMAHDKYDQLKELNTNQYLEIKNLENQLNEINKLKEEIEYKFRETSSQFVQLQEKENQTENKYQEVLNERNNMKKQLELTVEEKRNLIEKEKALKTQLSQVQLQLEEAKVDFNSKLEEKEINESNLNNNIEKLKQQVQMLQESLSTSSEKIQQSIISEESLKKKDELLESLTNENLENKKKVLNVQSLLTQKDLECKSIISQFEEFTSQTQSYIKLMEKSELENNNKITEKENKILQLENEIQEFKQLIEQNKQKNYEVLREEINQWSLKLNKAEQLKKSLEEKLQENENQLEEERKRALILKEKQETSNSRIQELERKLEEAIRNYETTQIDLETALSLNIENAKKFERELQYTEDLFKLREERRKTNIVKSIFSENTSSPSRWFKKKDPLPIANALGETDKSGYLYKQGDWVRSWRKKWMVLKGDKIYIFDSPQDEKPKAQIELNDCFIRKDEELIGMDNSFGIYNTINVKKVNFLRADTQEERDEWISAINQNIENLKFLK